MSQSQIINNPKIFKDFFACRIVLDADHQQPGIIQRLFRLQICLGRKSSIPQKYSKTFSPAELSQPQIINNMEIFKDFFACRIVLAADHRYPENIQTVFHLQICLGRKSSLSRKHSKNFSPAELSWPQIIDTPEVIKNFSNCRIVLDADHQQPGIIQRLFRLQNCLGRKSSLSRKHSKTFSPADLSQLQMINNMEIFKSFPHAELSQPQIINNLEIVNDIFTGRNISVSNYQQHGKIQRFFCLQNCLSRRSSVPRKYSNSFSPADKSESQIINNPKILKDFFACRVVLAADHRCPGNIQTLFYLQNCLSRKSSTTWKFSNLFHMQNSLSRKSSTTWKQSTTFSPAEISQSQIINNMETFKVFFACRNVLAANHHYPENIHSLFRLQNCLGRRSSIPRKYSKIFSPADMSYSQIINNSKIFKDFFACRIVLDADHQQPGNIQRFFRLQICPGRKSSLSRKHSKNFSPAELSWPQIIDTPEKIKIFSTCRIVLAANHQ